MIFDIIFCFRFILVNVHNLDKDFTVESLAARLERSSFCEEERRAKKRERKADKAAQIISIFNCGKSFINACFHQPTTKIPQYFNFSCLSQIPQCAPTSPSGPTFQLSSKEEK